MKQVEGAGRLCYKREFSFLFNISNSHSNLSVLWDNSVDPDRLVALTATEFRAGPSVSTRFTACHIVWFPTRFPKCHGVEGSAGPKQSLEVQKFTSNPRNSPSFPGPLPVQFRNGATKLP